MRQRFLIIHNHGAGSGRDDLLDDATTHLQTTGARVTRREAHGEAMGWRMADEAARSGAYDAIVAAGGDGTIRDVADRAIASGGHDRIIRARARCLVRHAPAHRLAMRFAARDPCSRGLQMRGGVIQQIVAA